MAKAEGGPVCGLHQLPIAEASLCEWCRRDPELTHRIHELSRQVSFNLSVQRDIVRNVNDLVRDLLSPQSLIAVSRPATTSTSADPESGATPSKKGKTAPGSKS